MSKQDRHLIAQDFIAQYYCISSVLKILKIPSSTYYYTPTDNGECRGTPKSLFTKTLSGKTVQNTEVVSDIETLLAQEFVDYGVSVRPPPSCIVSLG